MRLKGVRSLRELTRILDIDRRLRRLSLIRGEEKSMEGLHSCTDPELVDELLKEIQELNLFDDKSRKK